MKTLTTIRAWFKAAKANQVSLVPASWSYYPEPFDITQPPPAPPNRDVISFFGLWIETKDSKRRSREWRDRLNEYGNNVK